MEEEFVHLLSGEQIKLLRYIAMLLGDTHEATNVLQETNLVLCRKADQYERGTSFSAWAHKVAYWQVLAFMRDRSRDRHVFSEELIGQLASRESGDDDDMEARLALRHCLKNVSRSERDLLRGRYEDNSPIAFLSKRMGKSEAAVRKELWKLRRLLLKCVQQKLAEC